MDSATDDHASPAHATRKFSIGKGAPRAAGSREVGWDRGSTAIKLMPDGVESRAPTPPAIVPPPPVLQPQRAQQPQGQAGAASCLASPPAKRSAAAAAAAAAAGVTTPPSASAGAGGGWSRLMGSPACRSSQVSRQSGSPGHPDDEMMQLLNNMPEFPSSGVSPGGPGASGGASTGAAAPPAGLKRARTIVGSSPAAPPTTPPAAATASPFRPSPMKRSQSVPAPASTNMFDDGLTDQDYLTLFDMLPCAADGTIVAPAAADAVQRNVPSTSRFHRMVVLQVDQHMRAGTSRVEKRLRLFDERANCESMALLHDDWVLVNVSVGDIVHVIGTFGAMDVDGCEHPRVCLVSNVENMLVVHPDVLISGTRVAGSFGCMRRAVLNERLRYGVLGTASLYGQLAHDLFEFALLRRDFETATLDARARVLVERNIEKLYACDVTELDAMRHLRGLIPSMQTWCMRFLQNSRLFRPSAAARIHFTSRSATDVVSVKDVLATEENVWSPMYGLKGKVDATVLVQVDPHDGSGRRELVVPLELKTGRQRKGIVDTAHQAQVLLYTLLLSDRRSIHVDHALLLYLSTNDLHGGPVVRDELRALIIRRNELATFLLPGNAMRMPPMLLNRSMCRRCYKLSECMLVHKMLENGTEASSGIDDEFAAHTQHLSDAHKRYFAQWYQAITAEEACAARGKKDIWHMTGAERERRHGRCFADMVIERYDEVENGVVHTFVRRRRPGGATGGSSSTAAGATMMLGKRGKKGKDGDDMLESHITPGDYIVVSDCMGGTALATGFITELTSTFVSVRLERQLDARVQGDIEDVGSEGTAARVVYRLDKDELMSSFQLTKKNLIELFRPVDSPLRGLIVDLTPPRFTGGGTDLMSTQLTLSLRKRARSTPLPGTPSRTGPAGGGAANAHVRTPSARGGDRVPHTTASTGVDLIKRRRVAKDLKSRFAQTSDRGRGSGSGSAGGGGGAMPSPLPSPLPTPSPTVITPAMATSQRPLSPTARAEMVGRLLDEQALNSDQRRAAEKVLCADDYALVLGMPGTGKTTTIASLVYTLVRLRKSVLLSSYTHTGVDNILLKLMERDIDFVRLGRPSSVHPDVRPRTLNHDGSIKSVGQLETALHRTSVVATTCLGVSHPVLAKRRFDYCIVDEASQITQPVCLGPLRFASVFVLVGDHYQLPPLVRSAEAAAHGMGESLFRRLTEAHPHAVVNLEYQYRMNADVMALANTLVYNGKLKCGTPSVARARLCVPRFGDAAAMAALVRAWGTPAGSAQWLRDVIDPARSVVFVDTDAVPCADARVGDITINEAEAVLVGQLTCALRWCGVEADTMGIISPYRAQLKQIAAQLEQQRVEGVECHTVDKYQGRDKECIVISMVRSNDGGRVGDLLRDWRRVNVALTRSKHKLVIIGSQRTLRAAPVFDELLTLLAARGWIYALAPGATGIAVPPLGGASGPAAAVVKHEPPRLPVVTPRGENTANK